MSDHRELAATLTARLAALDKRLATFEEMAASAKGRLSPTFAAELDELHAEHKRLKAHISAEELKDALGVDSGPLEMADAFGRRLDRLLSGR